MKCLGNYFCEHCYICKELSCYHCGTYSCKNSACDNNICQECFDKIDYVVYSCNGCCDCNLECCKTTNDGWLFYCEVNENDIETCKNSDKNNSENPHYLCCAYCAYCSRDMCEVCRHDKRYCKC